MSRKYVTNKNKLYTWCKENNRQYLLDEYDYKKNYPLTPKDITKGSHKKIWWTHTCVDGTVHSWEAVIRKRAERGDGCPYCSNKALLVGYNDLETWCKELDREELLGEWAQDLNEGISPKDVVYGSNKKVYWRCKKDHVWQAMVYTRTAQGYGCRLCSKSQTSFPEQLLYITLKKQFPDTLNRYKIDGFEFDVYIPRLKFAIEYDGIAWHNDTMKKKSLETNKNEFALKNGMHLLRVKEDKEKALDIEDIAEITDTNEPGTIKYRFNGTYKDIKLVIKKVIEYTNERFNLALSYAINKKDIQKAIKESTYIPEGKSLQDTHPEIAEEWHPTKNGKITPADVTYSNGVKYWWIGGDCGHEWEATCSSRTNRYVKLGCPICAGKIVLAGFNSVADTHGFLIKDWDKVKNGSKTPYNTIGGTHDKIHWKCHKCGNEWSSSLVNRSGRLSRCENCRCAIFETNYNKEYSIGEVFDYQENIDYITIFNKEYYDITKYYQILTYLILYINVYKNELLNRIVDVEDFNVLLMIDSKINSNEHRLNKITRYPNRCRQAMNVLGTDIYIEADERPNRQIVTIQKVLELCDFNKDTVKIKFKETHKQESINPLEALGYTKEEIDNMGEMDLAEIL